MTEPLSLDRILKKSKGTNDSTLFDHISALLEKMMNNQTISGNFYEDFEKISSFLKHNDFRYKEPRPESEVNKTKEYTTQLTEWYNECLSILEKAYKQDE